MQDILIDFLCKFNVFSAQEIEELVELLTVKEIKKNHQLVNAGDYCSLCFFVLRGCLRQYIIQDGIEKTIGIYTENQAINYYSNQSDTQKTDSYLLSVEDAVLLIGDPRKDAEMFTKYPILADITRKMLEQELGKTQSNLAKMITSSPEQRYLDLLAERPELVQRLPQHIIASFLGITPESLSRIRKRLADKNKH